MSKEFSKKQLEQLAKAGDLLIFPKNAKELYKEKEEYLRSIGATDEDINTGCELCPEPFWWEACELVEKLAQELLDEREKKFDALMAPLEDVERELKVLKKAIKSKFKGYE
jgi:chromosome segregation ATPase